MSDDNIISLGVDERRQGRIKQSIDDMTGPQRTGCAVFVQGRLVPDMTVHEQASGEIGLMLDSRMMWIFPREIAAHVAEFAANAMAIGAGFPCFTADKKREAFASKVTMIGELPDGPR